MRKLPPLIQLRAFEAAARHLSFKHAADELYVSPTAISHQIKQLEEYLNCKLFRRQPRPLSLTAEGRKLYPALNTALDECAAAVAAIRQQPASLQLKLTTTSSFATMWLVPRLSEWRKIHPNLDLEIIATDSLIKLGSNADFSVRYMFEWHDEDSSQFALELFRDNLIVVCNPELLDNGQPFGSLAELKGQTLVHTHWLDSDTHAPIWPRWFERASKHYGEVADLDDFNHLTFHEEMHAIDAVTRSSGFMVISDFLVAGEIASGNLVQALDYVYPGYGFYLTYDKNHPNVEIFQSFADWAIGASA